MADNPKGIPTDPQRDPRLTGTEGHGPGPAYNDTHPTHNAKPERELEGTPEFDDMTGRRPTREGPHESVPGEVHPERKQPGAAAAEEDAEGGEQED